MWFPQGGCEEADGASGAFQRVTRNAVALGSIWLSLLSGTNDNGFTFPYEACILKLQKFIRPCFQNFTVSSIILFSVPFSMLFHFSTKAWLFLLRRIFGKSHLEYEQWHMLTECLSLSVLPVPCAGTPLPAYVFTYIKPKINLPANFMFSCFLPPEEILLLQLLEICCGSGFWHANNHWYDLCFQNKLKILGGRSLHITF